MTKPTPGPWKVEISPVRKKFSVVSPDTWICGEDTWICGEIDNRPYMDPEEAYANAKAIAAVPQIMETMAKMITAINELQISCEICDQTVVYEKINALLPLRTHAKEILQDLGLWEPDQ